MLIEKPAILILGGSEIAYQLAQQLQFLPLKVISSLAGRTQNPRVPVGIWRIGGFGGVGGLIDFLHDNNIRLIIDATHPFARNIQANARAAASLGHVPLWRLQNPPWQPEPGDQWIKADDEVHAASLLSAGSTVFLALGRQHLQAFAARHDVRFIARMIEMPDHFKTFSHIRLLLGKPATQADEARILRNEKIDLMVCRNSGALASYGKIAAARELGLRVVMITPPPYTAIPIFTHVSTIVKRIDQLLSDG